MRVGTRRFDASTKIRIPAAPLQNQRPSQSAECSPNCHPEAQRHQSGPEIHLSAAEPGPVNRSLSGQWPIPRPSLRSRVPQTTNLLNLRDARRFGNRLRSGLNPSIRLTTTLSVFFYRRSCQSYADNARNCARTPDPRSRWSQFRALLVHYPLLNFVGTVVSRSPPDRAMHRVLAFAFSLGCSIALAHLKRAAQSGVEARLALGA